MQGTYSDREQMLRRSIRDIIALSALPALWKSQTPADLAQNLVDAVCSALDGDCSCIRFKTRGGGVIFVASTAAQKETLTAAMLADRLAAFLEKSERWVGEAPNPVGPGQARIAVVPLESGRLGALVVTSTRPGFPDETGHLLLGLAGTQVSLLLDRAEAIQAISENEQRLRLLIEQSPLAILTFSPDGRAIGANPAWARLWETVPEAVAGYNLLLDAQLEAKGVMPLVQEAFEGRSVHIPRLYYDAAQGGTGARARWIDTHIYPIKDSAGSVLEIVMMLEDVTDGVRLEQQLADMNEELEVRVHERTAELEAANREMETFTYTVAHDLRSPLRAIVATSMILKEDFIEALPMDARPELESQARAAKRLGILIDELLKLSRLGREPLNRANVDISKMCSDVVAELRGSGHGTVCTFEIEPQMTA
ncbi:MAG: hypothetical protein QOJ65_865, partial [Fimbriimonadaceae bacterium]|nr:hypothetical protein [Fimbriimonadaceae bacterium]